MLSYSTREIRRRGDQSTVGPPGLHSAVSLMSFVLTGGPAAIGAPPSAVSASIPPAMSSERCPPVAHAGANAAATPNVATTATTAELDGSRHRARERLSTVTHRLSRETAPPAHESH